jgi:hypothetical protein
VPKGAFEFASKISRARRAISGVVSAGRNRRRAGFVAPPPFGMPAHVGSDADDEGDGAAMVGDF